MDESNQPSSSSITNLPKPSTTILSQNVVQDQGSLITSPPELRLRAAIPEPQQDPCQQASQSASQAVRQASQQASDSIRQASQQASQSADAASRSASEGIRQAQQSASQSIAQASRSVDSAVSSANSAISSISASAADAISRANDAQTRAQASASSAQADASKAVLNAGAAVAAATGKAAAAGSSFLAAAASATQSAQASVSAFGSAAASQINQASEQAKASQTTAITATQTAVAIVGSIIASALITILIYFLIARHKKKKSIAKKERGEKSPASSPGPTAQFSADTKFPVSDQVGATVAGSQGAYTATKSNDPGTGTSPRASFSLFPRITSTEALPKRVSLIKTTSVPWNPHNPPKPPSLGSWLKLQDGVSPFGPIKLSTDEEAKGPLGGQLKSPLRSTNERAPSPQAPRFVSSTRTKSPSPQTPRFLAKTNNKSPSPQAPRFVSRLPMRSPRIPNITYRKPITTVDSVLTPPPSAPDSVKRSSPSQDKSLAVPGDKNTHYRESNASVWTDEVPDTGTSPYPFSPLDTASKGPQIATQAYRMEVPEPRNPVRTTAEWLHDQSRHRDSPPRINPFTSILPKTKYTPPPSLAQKNGGGMSNGPRPGLPAQPGPQRNGTVRSMEGELGYVDDLRDSNSSLKSQKINAPEVGKAM